MDTWNREELYAEIWEQPLVKIAGKYGISAVMLGKVCRKLQIPLPGRGYWTKKDFGKPVQKILLPEAKNLPVVQRVKQIPDDTSPTDVLAPDPTDPEYKRILQIEACYVVIDPGVPRHKLVSATAKSLRESKPDNRGVIQAPWNETCLDVRVSKESIDRALSIINAIILFLEAEKFPIAVKAERHGTRAMVFGHSIPFSIVEKARETSRREVTEYSYTHTLIEYQPSGELEFRAGQDSYGYRKFRDGKTQKLEDLIAKLAGAVLREGRDRVIRAEEQRLEEIKRRKIEQQRASLGERIAEEEKKVRDLESLVNNWERSQKMREFVVALTEHWGNEGYDLSPESENGQQIAWMKQQADRLDPLVESPKSILDRKPELSRWY